MPTIKTKMGGRVAFITFGGDYKPGDPPPPDGAYNDWQEWAGIQHKAGLRQAQCGSCGLWRFPQELSERRIESTHYRDKAMTSAVKVFSRVCLKCEQKREGGST
jgi:hypothetical protein